MSSVLLSIGRLVDYLIPSELDTYIIICTQVTALSQVPTPLHQKTKMIPL